MQKFSSFTLQGDVGKLWDVIWTDDQKQHCTWYDFEYIFDRQYISDIINDLKRQIVQNLEQGGMTVSEYEIQFLSLSTFIFHLYLSDEVLVKMFKDRLYPQIRGLVAVHCLKMLRDVVEAALITDRGRSETQRSYGA